MLRLTHCLVATSLAALLLAGCGNKGNLVLPDQPPKKQKKSQPAPPANPADAVPTTPPAGGSDPLH